MRSAIGREMRVIDSEIAAVEPETKTATIGVTSDVPHEGQPSPMTASRLTNVLPPTTPAPIFCWWRTVYTSPDIAMPCTRDTSSMSMPVYAPFVDESDMRGSSMKRSFRPIPKLLLLMTVENVLRLNIQYMSSKNTNATTTASKA